MRQFYQTYFGKGKPLQHYLHHFIVANIGLFFAYLIFGSITIWEVLLFLSMTYAPFIDELAYTLLNYLDDEKSRGIVTAFFAGEAMEFLKSLHEFRAYFNELILHNLPIYFALWALWYVALVFDISLLFYGLSGLLIHLMLDLINDQYEFSSLNPWLWPMKLLHLM